MRPRLEVNQRSDISAEVDDSMGARNVEVTVRHDNGQAILLRMKDVKRLHAFLGKVKAYKPKQAAAKKSSKK